MDKNVIVSKKYGRAIYEIALEQNSLEKQKRNSLSSARPSLRTQS